MDLENNFTEFEGGEFTSEIYADVSGEISSQKKMVLLRPLIFVLTLGCTLIPLLQLRSMELFVWYSLPVFLVLAAIAIYSFWEIRYLNQFNATYRLKLRSDSISIPDFMMPDSMRWKSLSEQGDLVARDRSDQYFNLPLKEIISYYQSNGRQGPALTLVGKNKKVRAVINQSSLANHADEVGEFIQDHFRYERPTAFGSFGSGFNGTNAGYSILLFSLLSVGTVFLALNKNPSHKNSTLQQNLFYSSEAISSAMSWGTNQNPAILPDVTIDNFRIEKWPSGNLKSKEPIKNGLIEGMGEYYFDNGKLYGKIPYLHGQKHGSFTLYLEDGSIDQELRYKNGQPNGVLRWYHPPQAWLYIDGKAVKKLD